MILVFMTQMNSTIYIYDHKFNDLDKSNMTVHVTTIYGHTYDLSCISMKM